LLFIAPWRVQRRKRAMFAQMFCKDEVNIHASTHSGEEGEGARQQGTLGKENGAEFSPHASLDNHRLNPASNNETVPVHAGGMEIDTNVPAGRVSAKTVNWQVTSCRSA
jgi:hypothetical protein